MPSAGSSPTSIATSEGARASYLVHFLFVFVLPRVYKLVKERKSRPHKHLQHGSLLYTWWYMDPGVILRLLPTPKLESKSMVRER